MAGEHLRFEDAGELPTCASTWSVQSLNAVAADVTHGGVERRLSVGFAIHVVRWLSRS